MRARATLAGVLLAGAVLLSAPGGAAPAAASCVGPDAVGRRRARCARNPARGRGGRHRGRPRQLLRGRCDDTGGQAGGCSAPEVTERPQEDIGLTLRRADRVLDLGSEDAGIVTEQQLGEVRWEATLPTDLAPGRAVLTTDAAAGGRLVVRVVAPTA